MTRIAPWLVRSREVADFSYDVTDLSSKYLASFLHVVTGVEFHTIEGYLDELATDDVLRHHIKQRTMASRERHSSDSTAAPGRRALFYALVRATKPRVVVEAGVSKGHGTSVLAAALMRNEAEGRGGRVYGVEMDAEKGFLFGGAYSTVGELVFTDIRAFLRETSLTVDLYIHDTANLDELEREEYSLVTAKLAPGAAVCSVWASEAFLDFARQTGRMCLVFPDEPKDHWYPGAKIAVAFVPERERDSS
jgi:hypothetical protein